MTTYTFNQSQSYFDKLSKNKLFLVLSLIIISIFYYGYNDYRQYSKNNLLDKYDLKKEYAFIQKPNLPNLIVSPRFSPLKKNNSPIELSIKINDNFTKALLSYGIHEKQIENIKKAISSVIDFKTINFNQTLDITLGEKKIESLSPIDTYTHFVRKLSLYAEPGVLLDIKGDGQRYTVKKVYEKIYEKSYLASGKITSSLSADAKRLGVPNKMINDIIKLFSLNIDFRQLQKNDSFEFNFNKFTNKDGKIYGYNKFNYASLTVRGKKHEMFFIQDNNGKGTWLNEKGLNSKPLLMKTPIDGARLSSDFGMRRHPILGYTKQHTGIDFAASTGTPIYASGDGEIVQRYRSNSYGNYIKIRHNKTFDTAYAHMSRFGKFSIGQYVKQGDIIGYVGTTGRSTGPHLHYEVHKNSVPVNPHSNDIPTVSTVTAKMKKELDTIKQKLAQLRSNKEIQIVHNSINEIKY